MDGGVGFGRVGGGRPSPDDDPGCIECGAIRRSLCECGAVKVWKGRDGHVYLGDPEKPSEATHSATCECSRRIFKDWNAPTDKDGNILSPLERLQFRLRGRGLSDIAVSDEAEAARQAREKRDQEYREALAKSNADIGRPLDKPRSEPPTGTCPRCGAARDAHGTLGRGGKCSAGCDSGHVTPNNIGRGKGAR